jgi:NSS family neurotransmitter:Na+ symporter
MAKQPTALEKKQNKDQFSNSGFILAAIGSSVGLGNMWMFPYVTGENGGGAFFLLFLVCLLVVGMPVLLAELAIGRGGRGDAASSFRNLTKKKMWHSSGLFLILGAFMIMTFYSVVAGWTLQYTLQSFVGNLYSNPNYADTFNHFTAGWMPIVWQVIIFIITGWIVAKGISGGIEKFNKIVLPALLIILIALMVRSLFLQGAGEGVSFFLKPDFSKITMESVLQALGQAFFSLSLGVGGMMTYGAYVEKNQSLSTATVAISAGSVVYALIAGLIIFPTTFSFGIPSSSGPGLVFIALPAAFASMPFGHLFGGLFFVLLAIAALTSAISLLEVPVAYGMNKWHWSRKKAAIIVSLSCYVFALPCALSAGGVLSDYTAGGKTFFDWMNYLTSNVMLPLGGLMITIFAGYVWGKAGEEAGLTAAWFRAWIFTLRYIAPVLIVAILLFSTGILHF